jgi:hypothetical protein
MLLVACTPASTTAVIPTPAVDLIEDVPTDTPEQLTTTEPLQTPTSKPTLDGKTITATSKPESTDAFDPLSMQVDNTSSTTRFSPKRSQNLLDNHIGVHAEGYFRYNESDYLVYDNGFKWIRIQSLTDFWAEDGDNQDQSGHKIFTLETIPPEVDATISEYINNEVNIVLGLWMGSGLAPYDTTFNSQAEVDQYIDYVRFVVSHFKDRVQYYEIWNELGVMSINNYANLSRKVVPVIRQEDPQAKIIIGAIAGPWDRGHPGYGKYLRFSLDINQLNDLITSGVAPLVDGISWHPLYSNIADDPYYQNYPEMVLSIMDLAKSQGFTGEYFADELFWTSVVEENWENGPPVNKYISAKYYIRSITENRGLGVNVSINTFFQDSFMAPIFNINNILAGAEPFKMEISVESDLDNIRHYSFSRSDGEVLISLWNNGNVVDTDPGIEGSVTLFGISADQAIGIDPFVGIQQKLEIDNVNENLTIRGLLIKDYPIFILIK